MKELPPRTTRPGPVNSDSRKAALAARLRENLLRRKQQSRARNEAGNQTGAYDGNTDDQGGDGDGGGE